MAKYVSASAAARILDMNEKTIRTWIETGKLQARRVSAKRFNVSMDEVHRIALVRGIELPSAQEDRIADLKLHLASLDMELLKLRSRVEQLEQAIERIQKPVEAVSSSTEATTMKEKRLHASKPVAAKGTLPEGYRGFTDFFREHGIAETTAGRGVQTASIDLKEGNWRTATGKMAKKALDAEGQVRFCQFFSTHQAWHQCEIADCPCHGSVAQQ